MYSSKKSLVGVLLGSALLTSELSEAKSILETSKHYLKQKGNYAEQGEFFKMASDGLLNLITQIPQG